jgi:Ca-activated chloride channel family protein
MKRGTCGLLLLLAFLLASPAVGAQPDGGAIYGTIVDEAGAVLPGVTVTVFHLERGTHRKNVTNERGLYRVAGLEIGTYVLTAELAGFAAYRREGIEVRSGREKRIDVVLRIAGVTETVTVTGEAPPIHSQRMVAASPLVAAPPDWRLPPPGQGFHTEAYDRITDNPFRSVLDHPLSTFSIDVDRASYSNTRRFLNEYRLPPKDAVRIEELVNYFEYDYPDPEGDAPFGVTLEQMECPWKPEHRLVRIGLAAKKMDRASGLRRISCSFSTCRAP